MKSKVSAFNDWLAIKTTNFVGTMWCAYVFAIIALTSLPAILSTRNLTLIIAWIAQTFLQLVLLSVIMVGQNIASQKASDIHEDIKAHHHLLSEIHARIKAGESE